MKKTKGNKPNKIEKENKNKNFKCNIESELLEKDYINEKTNENNCVNINDINESEKNIINLEQLDENEYTNTNDNQESDYINNNINFENDENDDITMNNYIEMKEAEIIHKRNIRPKITNIKNSKKRNKNDLIKNTKKKNYETVEQKFEKDMNKISEYLSNKENQENNLTFFNININ